MTTNRSSLLLAQVAGILAGSGVSVAIFDRDTLYTNAAPLRPRRAPELMPDDIERVRAAEAKRDRKAAKRRAQR